MKTGNGGMGGYYDGVNWLDIDKILWDFSVNTKEWNVSMNARKGSATKEDLQDFKEEILHQFHVIFGGVVDRVKQVVEGVATVN